MPKPSHSILFRFSIKDIISKLPLLHIHSEFYLTPLTTHVHLTFSFLILLHSLPFLFNYPTFSYIHHRKFNDCFITFSFHSKRNFFLSHYISVASPFSTSSSHTLFYLLYPLRFPYLHA